MYEHRNHKFDIRGADGSRYWVITHDHGKALRWPIRGTYCYAFTYQAYDAAKAYIDLRIDGAR